MGWLNSKMNEHKTSGQKTPKSPSASATMFSNRFVPLGAKDMSH